MKIAVLLQNGVEEIEAITPIDIWRRADIEVDIISIENIDIVKGSHNISLLSDKHLKDVDLDIYDAIFLPGGPTTLNYLENKIVVNTLTKFNKQGKYIITICAGASVLANLKILENRKATCFPTYKHFLTENNFEYVNEAVVIDNNIISARSVANALELSLAVIKVLLGNDSLNSIKEKIIY